MLDELSVLTSNNVAATLAVLVALAGLVILVGNVMDAVRKLKKPRATIDACERRFSNDKAALEEHDRKIRMLEDGQCVMCEALHELLEHELHNGNAEQMREASGNLFHFLNKRHKEV